MGVRDLLRRRPRTESAAASFETSPAPSSGDDLDAGSAMRGDFMLLPPLRPTFTTPVRLQHTLDDFLVTHRPTTVTTEPLAHEIDPQRLGIVTARGRRSPRPRPPRDPLIHRQLPEEPEAESYSAELPPAPAPRRLSAATAPSVRPAPQAPTAGVLPSVSDVHRSVSAPSIRIRVPDAVETAEEFEAVREASRMENSTEAPIVRRRGGSTPSTPSTPLIAPRSFDDDDDEDQGQDIDLDSLQAPSAAEMPEIKGTARVRGALPPESSAGTRPLIGVDKADDAAPTVESRDAVAPEPLQHRSTPIPNEATSPSLEAPSVTGEPARSSSTTVKSDGSIPDNVAAVIPASPRETRSLLGERPSMSAAPTRTAPATSSSGKPAGAPGRTGVQRKARTQGSAQPRPSTAPAAPTARAITSPVAASAPATDTSGAATTGAPSAPPAIPASTGGSAPQSVTAPSFDATPVGESASAGSSAPQAPAAQATPVPPEVRKAVAAATGQSPDTVMIHQGAHADAESETLNAEAFTRDGEVYLPADASLDSPRGQALLAHELTHVVQQRGGNERMPDESSREGQRHEEEALKVERALAKSVEAPEPSPLEHASGREASGVAPANVPQGIQRRGLEVSTFGSINADDGDDDEDSPIGLPPIPEPATAHASALQPSVLDQVELVHAGQAPALREEPTPAGPSRGAQAKSIFERMMLAPGKQKPATKKSGVEKSAGAPATSPVAAHGGEGSGSGAAQSTGERPKPEPSAKEKGMDYFSRMMLSPSAPEPEDVDDRRGQLERQADSLYPYLRSRLRAELVRDRDRRGRLTREWR